MGKVEDDDLIDKWAADGKSILIWNGDRLPSLERIDAMTGKKSLVGEIKPPDTTGLVDVVLPRSTPDGKAHVYSEYRLLTDLFAVSGLH